MMKDDLFTRAAVAGVFGTVADSVIHWLAYVVFRTTPTAFYISELIFPLQKPVGARLGVAMFAHLISGGITGILLAVIFKIFGRDHPFFKGLSLSVAMWLAHTAIIPNLVRPRPYLFRTEAETVVDLLAHMVFGLTAVYLILKWESAVDENL